MACVHNFPNADPRASVRMVGSDAMWRPRLTANSLWHARRNDVVRTSVVNVRSPVPVPRVVYAGRKATANGWTELAAPAPMETAKVLMNAMRKAGARSAKAKAAS